MKRWLFAFSFFCFLGSVSAAVADGLPANPWQNQRGLKTAQQNIQENNNFSARAVSAVSNAIDKVSNSEEVQKSLSLNDKQEAIDKMAEFKKQVELMAKVADMNSAGQNQMQTRRILLKQNREQDSQSLLNSYEDDLRRLKIKYGDLKNKSINFIDDSYRRSIRTIKDTTGVDVERTIHDSIRAFK